MTRRHITTNGCQLIQICLGQAIVEVGGVAQISGDIVGIFHSEDHKLRKVAQASKSLMCRLNDRATGRHDEQKDLVPAT